MDKKDLLELKVKELAYKKNITMTVDEIKEKYFPDGNLFGAVCRYSSDEQICTELAYWCVATYTLNVLLQNIK